MTNQQFADQLHGRLSQAMEELKDIETEQRPRTTRFPDGEFDHEEWVSAEYDALQEERLALYKTIDTDGEFLGIA